MTNIHEELGDALKGKRIACQYRSASKERVIPMTGGHRGRTIKLRGNVYCVIEIQHSQDTPDS